MGVESEGFYNCKWPWYIHIQWNSFLFSNNEIRIKSGTMLFFLLSFAMCVDVHQQYIHVFTSFIIISIIYKTQAFIVKSPALSMIAWECRYPVLVL